MRDDLTFEDFWGSAREPIRRALLLSLGDADLAEEAVDEAMVRAYARWTYVTSLEDPSGWVYRVARNWAVSRLRWSRRRPTQPIERLDRASTGPEPDLDLRDVLGSLSIDHREVLVLRFYLDWPVDRIATAVGVPAGTIKSRIHRALGILSQDDRISHEA